MDVTATDDVRQALGREPVDRLIERLGELIGARAGVEIVFGQPARHEQTTVIPVARLRWGFGGGGGSADDPTIGRGAGSGGGGGVMADPLGYLEIDSTGATFRPIRERYPSPWLIIASGVALAMVVRALARLVRG
jgi:uncharacterized spore protein YtfJ